MTGSSAEKQIKKLKPLVERFAQFGYLARGIVHATIGVLALKHAMKSGGAATDARGALYHIFNQPLGGALLAFIAVGLLGHALWRFIQAGVDTENKGRDLKGILRRLGYFGGGVLNVALFVLCIEIILGLGEGAKQGQTRQWVSLFLSHPPGEWLVFASGIGVAGAGLSQLYLTYTAKFMGRFELHKMSRLEQLSASISGRIGHAARGVVFGMIGASLMRAALNHNSGEVWDFRQSLRMMVYQPYGRWLLAAVAIGLVTYGLFSLGLARYRRIELDPKALTF
jgi:hypothetical protein